MIKILLLSKATKEIVLVLVGLTLLLNPIKEENEMQKEVTLISSQEYISEEIVEEKIANHDFDVQLSPVFEVEGKFYQVIQDGHHSYHAAIESGVEPNFIEQTAEENDRILLLEKDVDLFLEASYIDTPWYDIKTGKEVW